MRRRTLPGLVVAGLVAATLPALGLAAQAATTVSPAEPGATPLVRDASITIDVDRSAMTYYRGSSTAAFAPLAPLSTALLGCRGDVPGGTDNSPRTTVTVTGPDGSTVTTQTSAVRDLSTASFLAAAPRHKPVSPAPAPASSNYRGDFADANAFHGMKVGIDLTGKPAGVYTITTTDVNKVKTGILGGCSTGTPTSNGNGGFTNAAPTPGPKVTTQTFEYRPWQSTFTDVLGKGKVSANITPREVAFTVAGKASKIYANSAQEQEFYGIPGGGFALPSDPTECLADLDSCLPPTAAPCDIDAGCVPRLMLVNRQSNPSDEDYLVGVFDLKTKAFIAHAKVDGTARVLFSLGTDNDAIYGDLLDQLNQGAAAQGIDLPALLGTEIRLGDGTGDATLSLLNGLQIEPSNKPGGVQITTAGTAQAGVVLHVYASLRLDGGACVARSGSSSTGRFTPSTPDGYTVKQSDVLPAVPAVGPLGALAGGPVWHIATKPRPDALANISSAAIGVDTASNDPSGYPVRIQPFLSGINTAKPKSFEFLGTGTWTSSQSPVGSGCLVANGLLGTGVALIDNPLPIGLGTLTDPLLQPSPEAKALSDAVLDVVDQVVEPVTSNPTIDALLTQLVGSLPLA